MRQSIEMILAATVLGEIGYKNQLPWRLKGDLRRFKELTLGKVLVMGRNTYESLPGPLVGRTVIVVSKTLTETNMAPDNVHFVPDFEQAMLRAASFTNIDTVMLTGGAGIYETGLSFADKIHYTTVYKQPTEGLYDAVIQNFDLSKFDLVADPEPVYERNHHGISVISHTYGTYHRRPIAAK